MQVLYDASGYITSFALIGELVGGTEVDEPDDLDAFAENFTAYRVRDGNVEFDSEKETALQQEAETEAIRQRREQECFSIINRGPLWYEMLTEEQKEELKTWYQAWLDATNTRVVPDKPAWL
jgi:hypothetical protein